MVGHSKRMRRILSLMAHKSNQTIYKTCRSLFYKHLLPLFLLFLFFFFSPFLCVYNITRIFLFIQPFFFSLSLSSCLLEQVLIMNEIRTTIIYNIYTFHKLMTHFLKKFELF